MTKSWIALGMALAIVLAACTDHATTQEAYTICEDLIDRVSTTTDEQFAACVACYEDCGEDCDQPSAGEFTCPD